MSKHGRPENISDSALDILLDANSAGLWEAVNLGSRFWAKTAEALKVKTHISTMIRLAKVQDLHRANGALTGQFKGTDCGIKGPIQDSSFKA
jgi:hypothetical protein